MSYTARYAPGLPLVALALLLPLLLAVVPPGPPVVAAPRVDAPSAEALLTPTDEAALHALVAADLRALRATANGWEVAHPEQQLRYAFDLDGLQVTPLTMEERAWHWAVRAVALQRDEAAWPLAEEAAPRRVGAGVRYERGPLAEWYAVRADGVEQGFTVVEAPEGVGPLRVLLRVATGLAAAAEGATAAVWRTDETGPAVLAYRGLRAWDAAGRELEAWLEPGADTLAVVVDDAGAAYPVTIDPLVQQQKLTAGDAAANANFGWSVAVSGDGNTALVGAYRANPSGLVAAGAAYVFVRSGTTWSQQQKLTASDAAAGDNFGLSVALSADGNTALVGAYKADLSSSLTDAGAAYVFVRSGTTWSQQQKLIASDAAANDNFGTSVALSADGNTALVGAYKADLPSSLTDAGATYVFVRSGTTWSQQQKLTASDAAANDNFGTSVALSADGNTALVGALNANTSRGAAYVFVRSGSVWSQQQKLTASDSVLFDNFGTSVALSADGNTALIGAYNADLPGPTNPIRQNAGAAYVFVRSGSVWSQQQKLIAGDFAANDNFGMSVALNTDGHTALVGAPNADLSSSFDAGAAYAFAGCPAGAALAARRAVDYDGNLRADFALWRPSTGTWYIRGAVPQVQYVLPWGQSNDVPVRGDYSGDGCADLMVWRPATGEWWLRDLVTALPSLVTVWGQSGDIPVPGDYDGDGKTDVAVWRPSTAQRWVRFSSTGTGGVAAVWGQSGDTPVLGDFDGDGKTDFAVWRPSTGEWWVRFSSTGTGGVIAKWGQSGDIPVPGDYDGDGKTDVAVWRPSTSEWWVRFSSTGATGVAALWGLNTDIPVPGDYDGDGRTDYAVWRPSSGEWWVYNVVTGVSGVAAVWGQTGDKPLAQTPP